MSPDIPRLCLRSSLGVLLRTCAVELLDFGIRSSWNVRGDVMPDLEASLFRVTNMSSMGTVRNTALVEALRLIAGCDLWIAPGANATWGD